MLIKQIIHNGVMNMKKKIDEKILKYMNTNLDEKLLTRFPDTKGEVLTPIIGKNLSQIEETEDKQEKMEGILQIILLLVLQYK